MKIHDYNIDSEEFNAEYANAISDLLSSASVVQFKNMRIFDKKEMSYVKEQLADTIDYFASMEQFEKCYYLKLVNDSIIDPFE